jgi:ribosomal-protein-alanine N-acetyltransferase
MTIETNRLLLRQMVAEDAEAFFLVFSDPRVMTSFGGNLFDRPQVEKWVQRNLAHQKQHGYGLFSVILKSENILIGDCGFEHIEVSGRPEVELGYDLRSQYWGQGYATEAAAAVRDFAWQELGLRRLVSLIRPSNLASSRVAEKIGMTKEQEITRGQYVYCVYSMLKHEC